MSGSNAQAQLRPTADVLGHLTAAHAQAGDALWIPPRQLIVADATCAREILANNQGLYRDHSDFFYVDGKTFGPRSAQVSIGSGARTLLRAHLASQAPLLEARVVQALRDESIWPDTANRLIEQHLGAVILDPESSPELRAIIAQVITCAVLAGAREGSPWWKRATLRFRTSWALGRAIAARRRASGAPAQDLLEVVVSAAGDASESEIAGVFLSCLFAAVGSVGFTLAWSLYLLATHGPRDAAPAWIVREALRLWPIAWLLARRPARAHELLGQRVSEDDTVVVCPYLVHRNPRYWFAPAEYLPERWANLEARPAFMPFGWGPHSCAAAALSLELVEAVIGIVLARFRLRISAQDDRPQLSAALAPPRFWLRARLA